MPYETEFDNYGNDFFDPMVGVLNVSFDVEEGDPYVGEPSGYFACDVTIEDAQIGKHTVSREWLIDALSESDVLRVEKCLAQMITEDISEYM